VELYPAQKLFLGVFALAALVSLLQLVERSRAQTVPTSPVSIVRLEPRVNEIVPANATINKVADGFTWTEGPVWNRSEKYLLFSEVPKNSIHKWDSKKGTSLFLNPSGYHGAEKFTGREPGSNGLTYDWEGRLVFCQHGDRRISRLEKDGSQTVLVDRYERKRLNSPNDLVLSRMAICISPIHRLDCPAGLMTPTKSCRFKASIVCRALEN